MFTLLGNTNFTFKNTDTYFTNPDNSAEDRTFRDDSTNIYTATFFNDINIMSLFVDYTYHALYSEVITNINTSIIDKIILNDPEPKNNVHIKPLVGDENVFLIFKGGSLMKHNFDTNFAAKLADNNLMNSTIQNVINKYFRPGETHNLTDFNIDLEIINPRPVRDANNVNLPNTARTFVENILNSKFKISDTDYSLFINSEHNNRFLIFNNICTRYLGSALDTITMRFDRYFNHVNNDNFDLNHPEHYLHQSDACTYDPNYYNDELLLRLKNFLNNNANIEAILNNDPQIIAEITQNMDIRIFLSNCFAQNEFIRQELFERERNNRNILNGNIIMNNDLFVLYDVVNILTLILYIFKLNNTIILNSIDFLDNGEMVDGDLITFDVLEEFIDNYKIKIRNIVEYKFRVIVHNNFYTLNKINQFKTNLRIGFRAMHGNPDYTGIKYKLTNEPNFYKTKVKKIRINNNIQNINDNDFNFEPKKSVVLTSSSDPFRGIESKVLKNAENDILKLHYITYNNVIRQTFANGKVVNDFDLLRSKFNITIHNDYFDRLDDNDVPIIPADPNAVENRHSFPSEFIDVSIVRYDDTAKHFFFDEVQKNFYKPYKTEILNNANNHRSLVYSYSPVQLTEDLFYVLTTKDILEPWIDKKYKKRIVRGVVLINFVINLYQHIQQIQNVFNQNMNHVYNQNIWGPQPNRQLLAPQPILNDYVSFFKYITKLFDNIRTNNVSNINRFTTFLKNYDPLDQNDIIRKRNYIISIKENLEDLLYHNSEIPIINIDHKYFIVADILKTMLFWNKLYFSGNNILVDILNNMRIFYHLVPTLHVNNIQATKDKFRTFIRILFDYGFKTLFLFDERDGIQYDDYNNDNDNNIFNNIEDKNFQQPLNNRNNRNNREENYFNKYLKYKTKYLNQNKKL